VRGAQSVGIIRSNPVFWQEAIPRRLRHAGALGWLGTLLGITTVGTLAAAVLAFCLRRLSWETPDVFSMLLATWAFGSLFSVANRTARGVARERQSGTWDNLLLTQMGPKEIFLGKLLAALIPCWVIGILLLPACALLAAITPSPYERSSMLVSLAATSGVAPVSHASIGALGLYLSTRCSSAPTAQVLTLLAALARLGAWLAWEIVCITAAIAGAMATSYNH
jgi:hypothetical protein